MSPEVRTPRQVDYVKQPEQERGDEGRQPKPSGHQEPQEQTAEDHLLDERDEAGQEEPEAPLPSNVHERLTADR